MQELGEFLENLAFKLEAFDPLDRCIPSDGDNQAISRDELLTCIEELEAV